MIKFLRVYRSPIAAVALWVVAALAQFRTAYLQALWCKLQDLDWWVENTFSVVIFTVIISWVVAITERQRERANQEPYEGRSIVLKGLKNAPRPQDVFWQDALKNESSRFEKWKFIKSAVSNICRIGTPTLEDAETRWVTYSPDGHDIVINFKKMTPADMAGSDPEKAWLDLQEKLEP